MARIIKHRILTKLGRNIIGPVLPRLAGNGTSERHGFKEKRAHVKCVSCGCEIGLEPEASSHGGGPAKCFSCVATSGIYEKQNSRNQYAR